MPDSEAQEAERRRARAWVWRLITLAVLAFWVGIGFLLDWLT